MRPPLSLLLLCLLSVSGAAASKPHAVVFGKWTQVKYFPADDNAHPTDLKVRPLFVDARLKEFTLGLPHDVTDRIFVVRRAFRLNDSLPEESPASPKWTWQRGGWLMIDRVSGKISPLNLPEFHVQYSSAGWYRDYVAYCGISEDGKKLFGIVAQLGRRKPILHKPIQDLDGSASECPTPGWQRQPARVTFPSAGSSVTYAIHGTVVDLITDDDDDP